MKISRLGIPVAAAGLAVLVLAPRADAAGGPYQYFAITPCRIVDTRTTSRVTNAAFVNFAVKGGSCGLPSDAVAASLNVTVVNPTGATAGFLSMWPFGSSPPNVSTMNYPPGEPAIANGAIVPLSAGTPDVTIGIGPCAGGCPAATSTYQLDVILDVTGYFK